jgi:hypothetical protein
MKVQEPAVLSPSQRISIAHSRNILKVLILDINFHVKNKEGFTQICDFLGWEYKYVKGLDTKDIEQADIIYSPGVPLSKGTSPMNWLTKFFIFGPHFEVFPKAIPMIQEIKSLNDNAVYIQPSPWVRDLFQPHVSIDVHAFPFPVNTKRFVPITDYVKNKDYILYIKRRDPNLIEFARSFFTRKGINVREFHYGTYHESNFLHSLQNARGVFWLGCHESQGFAMGEALACNVPLCVWDVKWLSDEWEGNRPQLPATSTAYWDSCCGEVFYDADQLEATWKQFEKKIADEVYEPRQFIVETLSLEACAKRLEKMLEEFRAKV